MKKPVIVKKNKAHRVGITAFGVAVLLLVTVCVLTVKTAVAYMMYIPILFIYLPIVIYYLSWQIRFDKTGIIKSVFFVKQRCYSFDMLKKTERRYYASEHNHIVCMYFADGKTVRIRRDDENYESAVKELLKHNSIVYV